MIAKEVGEMKRYVLGEGYLEKYIDDYDDEALALTSKRQSWTSRLKFVIPNELLNGDNQPKIRLIAEVVGE